MPEKDGSWLLGVVICSKTGMCLVNACSDPPLRVRQLCRMLPALHSLAAGVVSPTSHLDLVTCSAALCESRVGYIVAALTTPGADWRQRRESASFVAETVSRAFAWHGGENLESFIARDMDDAVMDATDAGEDADVADTGDATTHPEFRSFELEYLRPALAREFTYNRAPHVRWLEPLVGCVSARVAHAHVLIPRSTTGPVTNDDVVDATRDDRDLDDSTSSDAIRAKELVSRATWECVVVASARGIEAANPLARLCDVDAVGCGEIWRETRARCLAMAESRARRCLAMAEEVGGGFGGHRPSPRAKGGGVVRGPFAKREASTPPETAVLVFMDARVGRGGGEGKREGEGEGGAHAPPGDRRTLRAVIHAFSCHPGSAIGTACAVAFCVSPPASDSPGGDSPGSPVAGGIHRDGWPDEAPVVGWDPPEVSGYASRRVAGGTGATSSVMPTDLARAMFRVADAVRETLDPPFDWPNRRSSDGATAATRLDRGGGATGLKEGHAERSGRGDGGSAVGLDAGWVVAKGAGPPTGRGVRRVVPA